ncbi:MAG: hypothetical protein QXD61_08000 [Candidatus Caldarchaeum sp.]
MGVSFDLVGSIAVMNRSLDMSVAARIPSMITARHPVVKTVLLKTGPVSGGGGWVGMRWWRAYPPPGLFTESQAAYFALDLVKVFFSPRLSSERLRVVSMTGTNEVVVEMFAGVGPFSTVLAERNSRRAGQHSATYCRT